MDYHIIARTIMKKEYLLKESEKEFLLKLMKKLPHIYFVKVQSFIFMSNHIHIICQMIPSVKISDDDLKKRYRKATIGKKEENEAIKANFEGSHLLSFNRRIRYFSSDIVNRRKIH